MKTYKSAAKSDDDDEEEILQRSTKLSRVAVYYVETMIEG